MLRAGEAGAVVTYHADRLYRRTTDLERLVDLVEASGAGPHRFRRQCRRHHRIGQNGRPHAWRRGATRIGAQGRASPAKNDELAASGKPPGGRPSYGYGAGYTVEPTEAEAVRYMARRILEGASLLGVARSWTPEA